MTEEVHDRPTPLESFPPAQETGVQRAQERPSMPADDAGKLTAIYERVTGMMLVAEANRETLQQVLRENVNIGKSLDTLSSDNAALKKQNSDLLQMNRELFREVQEYRYNLENRMKELERKHWNLETRVEKLEGRNGNDDGPPDPAAPRKR